MTPSLVARVSPVSAGAVAVGRPGSAMACPMATVEHEAVPATRSRWHSGYCCRRAGGHRWRDQPTAQPAPVLSGIRLAVTSGVRLAVAAPPALAPPDHTSREPWSHEGGGGMSLSLYSILSSSLVVRPRGLRPLRPPARHAVRLYPWGCWSVRHVC